MDEPYQQDAVPQEAPRIDCRLGKCSMKRTITLRVDVADADDYADAVETIVYRNATYISDAQWTRGEEIRSILQGRGTTLNGAQAKSATGSLAATNGSSARAVPQGHSAARGSQRTSECRQDRRTRGHRSSR